MAGISFVSGDLDFGAISCPGFRDEGAFSSHFGRFVASTGLSCTVESGISIIGGGLIGGGLNIGTKADFTISSSDSSDEFSLLELISMEEFILFDILVVDGGLEDDGREDAGDKRDELSCSDEWFGGVKGECELGKARADTDRRLTRSYGRKGFLCKSSGCGKGNCGKYGPGGGIILPFIDGGITGCVPLAGCSGLKSGCGNDVGIVPGIGDPEIKKEKIILLIVKKKN